MKKFYSLITGSLLVVSVVTQLNAQCPGNRYHDIVFPAMPDSTMNVVYGYNITFNNAVGTANYPDTLKLDVYQPQGDTDSLRALIIFAHGGSFIGGHKADMSMLCRDFAKMGYVTATMDYRLLMNGLPFPGPDSNTAGAAVMRAVHDARAAVRFFRKNFTEGGNTYGIDTNNIYFGGASAGGFIALHLAYMDKQSEFPSYIDTTGITVGWKTGQKGLHGGIEGLSGNQGYSSKVKAIVNLSGAISDTAWMHAGDIPVISTHSVGDATVPYGRKKIYLSPPATYPIQYVNGSSVVAAKANEVGVINCFKSYPGNSHVPEGSSVQAYDTTLVLIRDFLEHFTCGTPITCTSNPSVGVSELASNDPAIKIFPNPAYNNVTVDLKAFSGKLVSIELYDALGRKVKEITKIKTEQHTITRGNLPNGIYLINVMVEGKLYSKKIIFE
ncbi:MAG: T9SS type A sorting domain-containing protein [Bacteroidetes bacterium]|nr:T9SS type A sorting domain-containing protein [Bacteroidota bacterium]